MKSKIWEKIKFKNNSWHIGIMPGLIAIIFITTLRLSGTLQFLELALFDKLLRLRPQEPIDERILIIGINESDIRSVKAYPIPDQSIAALLQKINTYQPAVIGLDIIRDLPQEPGHTELIKTFKETKNLIAVEKLLGDISGFTFNPPPDLPGEQIGFTDALIDTDGKQRRSLLAASNSKGDWKFSFSLKLAQVYLKTKNIDIENVNGDAYGIRFNSTIFPRFHSNSGGYIQADDAGSQILINFRSRYQPFRAVSLTDIQNSNVNPDWIRGKIVLIGMTNPSAKDYRILSAIKSKNSGIIYGVEVQAHEISQLISAVLDQRPLIKVWADLWEYLWIIIWGILGLSLCLCIRNPLIIFIYIGIASIFLFTICYGLINIGLWIPLFPCFLSLLFNSIGLAAFYRYEEALCYRIQDRQLVIEQTFDAIHSYPLQTLSLILREVQSRENLSPQEFTLKLKQLNKELRDVYDLVKRESISELNNLYFSQNQRLDLSQPLYDVLFEVYFNFTENNSSYFNKIHPKVIKFEPMNDSNLTIEQKRSLCRFLEEALRNVEKYAHGTTRLDVICTQEDGKNVIRVADNGLKFERMADLSSYSGFGTKLAKNLAKQLEGEFKRYPNSPKGIVCQLTWSAKKRWFWLF
ncbi:CHASE2 domain-containing protein [Aulosira sp. FACHB-615]|uniref:CHASE2 domain-containing protein n=1 Tax=Aulosira sp. FACHB-615 TaxID=2692777 RepID=UPI001688C61E|nr:CHASE2 domain-containing protein [Aulosira sp. FACHB-615]MBD2491236.1 CHASE2 domain-containing protein [Aulosira sp. FACHB-615]